MELRVTDRCESYPLMGRSTETKGRFSVESLSLLAGIGRLEYRFRLFGYNC